VVHASAKTGSSATPLKMVDDGVDHSAGVTPRDDQGARYLRIMTLTLSRPQEPVAPECRQQRVEGNDGLTDVEREEYAWLHQQHAGRQPSAEVLADVAEWLRRRRG
jgi:hypothetical protein